MNRDLLTARALGLCIAVVGGCVMTINGVGLLDALALIATVVISIWKLCWYVLGFGFTFIGVIWTLKPQRVLDTIARNQARKKSTGGI